MITFSEFRSYQRYEVIDISEEVELDESFATNKAHAMGLKYMGWGTWGNGEHATHRNKGGNLVALGKPVHRDDIGRNDSGEKSLSVRDLPTSMKKSLTAPYGSTVGDSSPIVRNHEKDLNSSSAVKKQIKDTLDKGAHGVLVTVNGKPVSMINPHGGSSARQEYQHHGEEGATEVTKTNSPTARQRRMGIYTGHSYKVTSMGKGDAVQKALYHVHKAVGSPTEDTEKDAYKGNKIEVHAIQSDPVRIAAKKERQANKVDFQTNYTNDPTGKSAYGYNDKGEWGTRPERVQTSRTNAGSMSDIQSKAADKFVDKKMPATESPKTKALALHKELGDLIASGAGHREIANKANELSAHVRDNGTSEDSYERNRAKEELKSGWQRKYGLERIRRATAPKE